MVTVDIGQVGVIFGADDEAASPVEPIDRLRMVGRLFNERRGFFVTAAASVTADN